MAIPDPHRSPPDGQLAARSERPLPRPAPPPRGPRVAPPSDELDNRSVGDLVRELVTEVRTLVRQEVQLAKTEAKTKARRAGKYVGLAAAGGFVAYAGFIALVMAFAFMLSTVMPLWLGFLIVSLVVLIIGYAVVMAGLKGLRNTDFSLERTAETLQEDKLWMKQEAQDVKEDPKHLGTQT